MNVGNIMMLFGDIALFLFGMSVMGDSLKKMAGNKMEMILYKLAGNPVKGVLLGTAVTAAIQSSSATSIMVVGFVNSSMMKVRQAIGIILGAVLGTSITGWILCLNSIGGSGASLADIFSTETLTGLFALIGILFWMGGKKNAQRHLGGILLGFAVLMYGMSAMSSAIEPLRTYQPFIRFLTSFTNPFVGALAGLILTAVIQSASAAVGILQALAVTGAIEFDMALPIIMDIGIGASVPVILSVLGAGVNGRRTAFVYLIINVLGAILFGALFYTLNAVLGFGFMTMQMNMVLVALTNTLYRLFIVLLLSPLIGVMERIVCTMFPDDDSVVDEQADMDRLEPRFLPHPAISINQCRDVINAMTKKTLDSVIGAVEVRRQYSYYSKDDDGNAIYDSSCGGAAAYAVLATMDNVDSTRLGISGHSMGTWAGWSVAAAFSGTEYEPRATVLQCGELFRDSVYDTEKIHFNNVLLLQAKWDEFSYFRDYKRVVDDDLLQSDLRCEFLGTTADKAAWDTTFGTFNDGSARRMELLYTNHRLTTHNARGLAVAIDWFREAFGAESMNALPATDQIAMGKEWLVLLAMLCTLLAMVPLCELLLTVPFFAAIVQPLPTKANVKPRGKWWRGGAVFTMLIAGFTYPFMTQLGHALLPLPEGIFRMTVGNGFVGWYSLLILVMVVTSLIGWRKAKRTEAFDGFYGMALAQKRSPVRSAGGSWAGPVCWSCACFSWSMLWQLLPGRCTSWIFGSSGLSSRPSPLAKTGPILRLSSRLRPVLSPQQREDHGLYAHRGHLSAGGQRFLRRLVAERPVDGGRRAHHCAHRVRPLLPGHRTGGRRALRLHLRRALHVPPDPVRAPSAGVQRVLHLFLPPHRQRIPGRPAGGLPGRLDRHRWLGHVVTLVGSSTAYMETGPHRHDRCGPNRTVNTGTRPFAADLWERDRFSPKRSFAPAYESRTVFR